MAAADLRRAAGVATTGGLDARFRYFSPWLGGFVAVWALAVAGLAADPAGLIARHAIFVPIGFLGSLIGNISAVGGGIVFIPCMIFLFHLRKRSADTLLAARGAGLVMAGHG